ncbi:MAG: prenyltransferase [Deltaproteobacteria bacterium]|nr:prenyltransferase [Deltaproteobacteria bacterium]
MASRKGDIQAKITRWFGLSRPPYHMVGILPFLLGTFLAWRLERVFSPAVFTLGSLGVVLVMLSTCHAQEYFDGRQDERSRSLYRNRLGVGSGRLPDGILPSAIPLWTSIATLVLAGCIGIGLQFWLKTGPLTLPMGCVGALPGLLYSARPVRLVERGLGEILIGACYGWIPVASAFYIQTGHIAPCIYWMALPIGLSIFNVILLNEFPDHSATPGGMIRTNLLASLGKEKGMSLYVLVAILSWTGVYLSLNAGIPRKALYLYLPVMAMSAVVAFMMARGKYENPLLLEILCGLNIAVYLGTTIAYLLAFV